MDRMERGMNMKVAVPWSLSHYIPLNGFHPLYRALFDHAPSDIDLAAWDNVKLHRHFASVQGDRNTAVSLARSQAHEAKSASSGAIARSYNSYFYPPDRVLTDALPGEIEFHHTAPYPSLTRPFVLHCESFAPVFFPFIHQGHGSFDKLDELRAHYGSLFASPLCQGIYSHIPTTLQSLSRFFANPEIDKKLFSSKIGLSSSAVDPRDYPQKRLDDPRFLFINSADQQQASFFNRGGHVVLRFWKEFRSAGHTGRLILRCGRPDDASLKSHGVDAEFVRSELGRSILWAEGYLANHEINALMADAHFFLLPSASLHSASILQAMTLGTVPIVTDTVGTSVYVTDEEHAVVLRGVKDEIWHSDPRTGVLLDDYKWMPKVTHALVTQMVQRVFGLLDDRDAYSALSHRSAERARLQFSGDAFASHFWDAVKEKALLCRHEQRRSSQISDLSAALSNCTIDRATWSRVFESASQPMPLLDTGVSRVWKLGGAAVHVSGDPGMALTDWSVLAHHFDPNSPETTFATTLTALSDLYLAHPHGEFNPPPNKWRRWISNKLMPYPGVHGFVSRKYRTVKKAKGFARLWLKYLDYKRGQIKDDDYTALVMENVDGFNVIRSFHKYYAIPQAEGAFIISKAEARQYSRTYCAYTLDRAIVKTKRGTRSWPQIIASHRVVNVLRQRIGRRRVRAVFAALNNKRNQPE